MSEAIIFHGEPALECLRNRIQNELESDEPLLANLGNAESTVLPNQFTSQNSGNYAFRCRRAGCYATRYVREVSTEFPTRTFEMSSAAVAAILDPEVSVCKLVRMEREADVANAAETEELNPDA